MMMTVIFLLAEYHWFLVSCTENVHFNPKLYQVLNPPLMFVIDTTKSVKPDKDSIFNLTGKVVESITNKRVNIPR